MWSRLARQSRVPFGLLLVILWPILSQLRGAVLSEARAQAPAGALALPASQSSREDDNKAIQAAMESFRKAFESRDAKALAEHWTAEGEYSGTDGHKVRGRDALAKGFQAFFAATPELTSKVERDEIRFLSNDAAIDEGTVTVRRGPLEAAASANFTALFVREDGKWRLAQLTESAADSIGKEQFSVYDARIANLTKDSTTILVHTGKGQSHQLTLTRLHPPKQAADSSGGAGARP
jgi:uncharacterized protein (TIGR02246 family)